MILLLYTDFEKPLAEDRYQRLLAQLPADLQQKIRRFVRRKDAEVRLLGKLLLVDGLRRFGLDGPALIHELQYTRFGRPYLPGPIDFNISHSGEYVLCALSDQGRVGVDLEKISSVTLDHFRLQMTDAEWMQVTTAADPTRAFYQYWTRKEAAIKAHGHGLSLPLKDVRIGDAHITMEGAAWPFYEIRLSPAYSCHLVTDAPVAASDIHLERVGRESS